MVIKNWNIEEMCGYKPLTTYYMDFSIAEPFGVGAIKETYNTAMECWKNDYKYLTEIVMVLNWKIFEHYGHNDRYAKLYDELWREADMYAQTHLKGEELDYFYRTTD